MKFNKTLLLLLIIIVVGSILRVVNSFFGTFGFTYDVGRDMLALADIISTHKLPLIGPTTGLPGLFYGPWWYYILLIPFALFRGNPQGVAFFMAVTGILTVGVSFFVGKKVSNGTLGLLFASFVGLSPALIGAASQIWNPNLAPLYIIIFLLLIIVLFQATKKTSIKLAYFFIGVLFSLTLDAEVVFGVLFIAGSILGMVVLLSKKQLIQNSIFSLLGFLVILAPRIYFEIRHNFLMSKTLVNIITHGKNNSGSHLGLHVEGGLEVLKNLWVNSFVANNWIAGLILFIIFIGITLRVFRYFEKNEKKLFYFLLLTLTTYFVGLILYPSVIFDYYYVYIAIYCSLLFGLSLGVFLRRFPNTRVLVGLGTGVLFLLQLTPLTSMNNYVGDVSVYRNQVKVIDYIYEDAAGKEFKDIVYTPPVHPYTYEYLFRWYGMKRYGYTPTDTAHLAYFILEPDKEMPERLNKWLIERKNDGVISKEATLAGEIRVQTRIIPYEK